MNISITTHPRAIAVKTSRLFIHILLQDGRKLSVPLHWFPKLSHTTPEKRNNAQIICNGTGIHWPDVDEDISVTKLITGKCED